LECGLDESKQLQATTAASPGNHVALPRALAIVVRLPRSNRHPSGSGRSALRRRRVPTTVGWGGNTVSVAIADAWPSQRRARNARMAARVGGLFAWLNSDIGIPSSYLVLSPRRVDQGRPATSVHAHTGDAKGAGSIIGLDCHLGSRDRFEYVLPGARALVPNCRR
jgi:hypothetical protein